MGRKKVLYIDDNALLCELVSDMLESSDIEITSTTDAREGLRLLMTEKPDLLLLDIDMPLVNGLDLLQQIRSMHNTYDLPVVMLTANEQLSSVQKAQHLGIKGYILKPFKQDYLLERVRGFLGLEGSSGNFLDALKRSDKTSINKIQQIKTKKLLVIDDDHSFGQLVTDILGDSIFAVEVMTDAREGLRLAMTQHIDVISLDLQMPEIHGLELGRQLKSMRTTKEIPLIVISGDSSPETGKKVQELEADEFLIKPLEAASLIQALETIMGKKIFWQV